MMALQGVSVGVVKVQWMTYLLCSSSLCVVPPPAVHAPTPIQRPVAYAMPTTAAKVWLCGMLRV